MSENLQIRTKNALSELGEKIFLDRYAVKDAKKETLAVGDTVVINVNLKTGQREIGTVKEVDRFSKQVEVTLRDGTVEKRAIEHVDKPLETVPEQMFERIARHIASVEKTPEKQNEWQGKFRELMDDWKYVPAGRIFTGAGTGQNLTFYNCYVIPCPQDSRGGIFDTLRQMAEIMSRGGGVGINVSTLRPRYAYVKGVNGRSSGSVSWASLYSFVTGLIEQGGCFGPNERIATNVGLVPAKELADRIEAGEAIYAQTHKGMRRITAKFRNGVKELYEVTTERGFSTEITADHKVAVLLNGRVETTALKNLKQGDDILLLLGNATGQNYVSLKKSDYKRSVMSTTLNTDVRLPEMLNEDLAYLVGYMLGDGYVSWGKKVNWSAPKAVKMATADTYPEIRQRIVDAIQNLFGVDAVIEKGDGACQNVSLYSRIVIEWLLENGLLKSKAKDIRVPESIFRSPTSVTGSFIAGYFDADGCNRGAKGGYGIDSISREMLTDVQQLLAANGVLSAIRATDRTEQGWQTIYRLSVAGNQFKERFADLVSTAKRSDFNGKRDMFNTYPSEILAAVGVRSKDRQGIYDGTSPQVSFNQLVHIQKRLNTVEQYSAAQYLDDIMHTIPDTITAIKSVGKSDVYDFEVEDVHLLSGGGVYTSNSRRGALMLILNVWHPDIVDFINAKREAGKITNANISVGITDDFMEAVKNDADWDLVFPDTSDPLYQAEWANTQGDIKAWQKLGGKVVVHKTMKAKEIWDQIISSAWSSAEPGVYFIDRANYLSNSYYYAALPCTNPCGEQPLPAWGVCNLGHVNLAKHLSNNEVDWQKLKETVKYAVRFQDNVIDATPYFFDENFKQQMSERRVGMGTIGLAEMLIKLRIRYGSDEAIQFIDKLYQFIAVTSYETSVEIAREKGSFPQFDAEKFLESGYMKAMPEYIRSLVRQYGVRNVTIMTQAPTGTIGTMVGTSTGIEPFFSWTYFRKSRLGVHEEKIKLAQDWLDQNPGQELPEYFVTAMSLAPEDHVRVQAAVQRWTDSAISKTCNAPSNYTVEDTKKLYQMMYDLGCKGGTIYRDGSRDEQILATDAKNLGKDVQEQLEAKAKIETQVTQIVQEGQDLLQIGDHKFLVKKLIQNGTKFEVVPRERPIEMQGTTYKLNTPYGSLFVTINEDEHGPFEVFAQLGKAGGFFAAQSEALCRMISLSLRSGVAVEEIIKQLKGIRSTEVAFNQGEIIYSLPDGIAKTMEKHINRKQQSLQLQFKQAEPAKLDLKEEVKMTVSEGPVEVSSVAEFQPKQQKVSMADYGHAPVCPDCSSMLVMAEGCMKCDVCGYSKCG
ncbi:MAG: adenosylcobalamin-dependent ribonucleoside-diphosphate reductase [Patescibacteria group bacterium]